MTDPDKSPGYHLDRENKFFAFWFCGLQIEIYPLPRDWTFHYYSDFGLLSLGPIVFNWSDDDL